MSKYIAVKVDPKTWKHFAVPEEVYTYIRQLEMFIMYPEKSKLKELYEERFSGADYRQSNSSTSN
jgi:hypothetical protein